MIGITRVHLRATVEPEAPLAPPPLRRPPPSEEQRAAPHCLVSPVLSEPLLLSRSHVYLFGREQSCTIRINSARVSRQHAQLRFVEGGFEFTDLRSTNGTFVNGIRLKRSCLLHDGDTLSVGGYEIEVKVVAPGELVDDDDDGATLPIRRRRTA